MEGDPIVDRLMKPVRATIEHHVKNQAGVIAIYNRAYEAIMNSTIVLDTMRDLVGLATARAEKAEAELAALRELTRYVSKQLQRENHLWIEDEAAGLGELLDDALPEPPEDE